MPNYIRPRMPGATVFFTVAIADRTSGLLVREVDLLRDAVRRTKAERPFEIEAWVTLPDHLHAVWRLPEGDSDFSTRWRLIKSRFSLALPPAARRASHRVRREKGIWQRRFWERHLRTEDAVHEAIRYCWRNPVKHGLVDDPFAWPHSSIHRDMRGALAA